MDISAVVPLYNGKKYLPEAIKSIINQTLQPLELILVDDGSSDNWIEEIRDIKANFPIHILTQKNSGQSAARNRGIQAAKGHFIALLDQDDIWYPRHLEELSKPFKEINHGRLGWTYSNLDQTNESGHITKNGLLNFCSFQHPQSNVKEMIGTDMYILPSASLIRKTALTSVGLFDERLSGYEDDDLFLRLYTAGWDRVYLPQSLSQWRIHSDNSGSSTGFKSRRIYAKKIVENFPSNSVNFCSSEIIGQRFFKITFMFYRIANHLNDYNKCKWLYEDLKMYLKLTKNSLRKWKYLLFLLKYPRLVNKLVSMRQKIKGT